MRIRNEPIKHCRLSKILLWAYVSTQIILGAIAADAQLLDADPSVGTSVVLKNCNVGSSIVCNSRTTDDVTERVASDSRKCELVLGEPADNRKLEATSSVSFDVATDRFLMAFTADASSTFVDDCAFFYEIGPGGEIGFRLATSATIVFRATFPPEIEDDVCSFQSTPKTRFGLFGFDGIGQVFDEDTRDANTFTVPAGAYGFSASGKLQGVVSEQTGTCSKSFSWEFELIIIPDSPACTSKDNKAGTLSWVNPADGAFDIASNWSPARSPLPSDDLLLDLDQNYSILLDGTETANSLLIQGGFPVLEGRGKLNLESLGEGSCGPSFSVEEGGRLLLTNGAAGDGDVTVSARTVLVGAAEGAAQSSLVLFGSTLEAPTSISVARNGSIHSGDAGLDAPPGLLLTPRVIVGQGTPLPADGFLLPSLELDGGAYDWDIAEVGEESPGLLSLSGGGILNLEILKLGQTPNQRGDVELSDPTTQLISDNAGVGDTGPGRLRISNGASFISNFLFLGIEESGDVLVEGRSAESSPSILSLSQARFGVEENGLASLQISQGGAATITGEARFGIKGAAFLTLADPESTLDIAGTTTLGEGGNGNLAINTGAKVTLLGALTLGAQASGVGDLKIEGAFNSELPAELSGEAITVGVAGEGTFEVRNGARARLSGDLEVASLPEGRGTVVLDGKPRTPIGAPVDDTITLASEGTLVLGAAGRATMNMLNGATAEFAAMRVGGGVQATRFTMESSSMTVATNSSSDELLGQVFIGGGEGRSVLELRRQSSLFVLSSPALLAAGDMFVQRNGLLRIDSSSVVSVREITVFGTLVGQVIEASTTPKQGETSGGIQGNVVISPEGTLALEFTAGQAGPALSITGNLTQDGTLEVRFLEDFEPFAGQILPLVDLSGESSGSFTAFRFPTRSNEFEGRVSASSTGSLELTVVNPGTAVPFDDGEGEQLIEGEGQDEGEEQAEGEGEPLQPQPIPGCNGCLGENKGLPVSQQLGEWLLGLLSLGVLLAARYRN